MSDDVVIGIAARNIEKDENITINLNLATGEVTSPDLIIDPNFKGEDLLDMVIDFMKRRKM